ncbi:unnamed protein product [Ectocarpus sp. CCAP 1310/34]|nr:unnamed protein product [Ectocarpus sp. CCAP 1310/34]
MTRRKKKKIDKRGADGRAVPKKPKPAQQHDLPSRGAGDALSDGHDSVDLMDVDQEEGKAAADEDGNDEDWCDEDTSGAHSNGSGQSILSFAKWSVASAGRDAGSAAEKNPPRVLSRSQQFRNRKKLLQQQAAGLARAM